MNDQKSTTPRVVITGMGAVTPLGIGVEASWQAALKGESGIRRVSLFDPSDYPCQIGGEVPDFRPTDYISKKEVRRWPRVAQLTLAALRLAMAHAGLERLPNPERTGVVMGTAIGGLDKMDEALHVHRTEGWSRVSPYAIPVALANNVSYVISAELGVTGMSSTIVTACAASLQAIAEGMEWIKRGSADLVITGGADATVHPATFAGFCAMYALPTQYNDNPTAASRPFDAKRSGFVLSEGCGLLILERLDHALARGATIYAELLGHGESADSYNIATPDPTGMAAVRAMRLALESAELPPTAIDYINAHGTSTPVNDKIESLAIEILFGEHAKKLPISSTKSVMGHAMGASGAIETIFCAQALQTGYLPPTINYEYPDPECALDYVPNIGRKTNPQIVLSNAFGLGGQNACLIIGK